ncbi:MAG: ribonuclease III [Lachnospiraceae bacterium]|nr:ribonuclease III [Lachnospiraceae bacterium]
MEESLSLLKEIHQEFGECDVDIRTYSPLTLAYIGDAIFEMVIRTLIVEKGQRAANSLHKHTTKIVCAGTQAAMIEALADVLTEEEQSIYRRGKNTKINSSAKNASLSDYRKATGFEALCGYLYLSGNTKRVVELIKIALEELQIEV